MFTSDHLLCSSRAPEQGVSVQGSAGQAECLSVGVPEQLITGGLQQWSAGHQGSGVLEYRGVGLPQHLIA